MSHTRSYFQRSGIGVQLKELKRAYKKIKVLEKRLSQGFSWSETEAFEDFAG